MQSSRIDSYLRVGVVLLTGFLAYFIYAGIHQRVVEAGDSAPDFTITADGGRTVSMSNFGGKLLVLNFWASWCGPCIEETPSLSQFAQRYAQRGVLVLGISVDRDAKAYQKFIQKYRPAFLTARDSQIHEDYGTFMYPETYLIDAHGRVLKKIAAAEDWTNPAITAYVDSLL